MKKSESVESLIVNIDVEKAKRRRKERAERKMQAQTGFQLPSEQIEQECLVEPFHTQQYILTGKT